MSRAQNRARRYSLAGDLSRQSPRDPAPTLDPAPSPAERNDGLRWGYVLADLERAARMAASTTRGLVGDFTDRYDEAFSAAAEYLYAAEEWMPERDLFRAARDALQIERDSLKSLHGAKWRADTGLTAFSAPMFVRYWHAAPAPSPEHRVVERVALAQIWPALTPRQQEAVATLAAFGNQTDARAAFGSSTFRNRLMLARRRFLELWHEGEKPSGVWARDRHATTRTLQQRLAQRRRYAAKTRGAA